MLSWLVSLISINWSYIRLLITSYWFSRASWRRDVVKGLNFVGLTTKALKFGRWNYDFSNPTNQFSNILKFKHQYCNCMRSFYLRLSNSFCILFNWVYTSSKFIDSLIEESKLYKTQFKWFSCLFPFSSLHFHILLMLFIYGLKESVLLCKSL